MGDELYEAIDRLVSVAETALRGWAISTESRNVNAAAKAVVDAILGERSALAEVVLP